MAMFYRSFSARFVDVLVRATVGVVDASATFFHRLGVHDLAPRTIETARKLRPAHCKKHE